MDKILIRAILTKNFSLVHFLKDIKLIESENTLFVINSVLINQLLNDHDNDYNVYIENNYIFIKPKSMSYPKYIIDEDMKCYILIIE